MKDKYSIVNISALLKMLNNISLWDDNDTTRENIDEIISLLENTDDVEKQFKNGNVNDQF